MSSNLKDSSVISEPLIQLSKSLDAMQLAQLCAFAFAIPQLYLCREYLLSDEQVAIENCLKRLEQGLNEQLFSLEHLNNLLMDKDFFDTEEARLRLGPEPEILDKE